MRPVPTATSSVRPVACRQAHSRESTMPRRSIPARRPVVGRARRSQTDGCSSRHCLSPGMSRFAGRLLRLDETETEGAHTMTRRFARSPAASRSASRRAGTTAGCGSPTGWPARSSPSTPTGDRGRRDVAPASSRSASTSLPDGRLLVVSAARGPLLRREADGSLVAARRPERPSTHAVERDHRRRPGQRVRQQHRLRLPRRRVRARAWSRT